MTGDIGVTDPLLALIAHGVRVYDMGRPMTIGMPQSQDHPPFRMVIPRRHGDLIRADGSSGANDLIITGSHVGTHIDALAHISDDGRLHGGVDAQASCIGGGYAHHGAETIPPMVRRAVLLDVAATLGIDHCPAAYEVTVDDLSAALARTGVRPSPGDVVLVRTGWGRLYDDTETYVGEVHGAPGPGEAGARWLAGLEPLAVGGDTVAFERIPAHRGYGLPGHRVLIVDHGIYIIEVLDLEQLAADGVVEFTFVLSPLKLVGATGSPVRPLGLVMEEGRG
ncbi:MAG TPA: cyclase family protein [Capillimicrobium sp.]|nr:cyclase family protein [Capillimicrobium sp.]